MSAVPPNRPPTTTTATPAMPQTGSASSSSGPASAAQRATQAAAGPLNTQPAAPAHRPRIFLNPVEGTIVVVTDQTAIPNVGDLVVIDLNTRLVTANPPN